MIHDIVGFLIIFVGATFLVYVGIQLLWDYLDWRKRGKRDSFRNHGGS